MPENSIVSALAEQGWSQADTALARGWRETIILERELKSLARTQAVRASPRLGEKVAGLMDQCLIVGQALGLAAGQRGLSLFEEAGRETVFDAQRHAATGPEPKRGAAVRVVAPGVVAAHREGIIVKADVAPRRAPAGTKSARAKRARG